MYVLYGIDMITPGFWSRCTCTFSQDSQEILWKHTNEVLVEPRLEHGSWDGANRMSCRCCIARKSRVFWILDTFGTSTKWIVHEAGPLCRPDVSSESSAQEHVVCQYSDPAAVPFRIQHSSISISCENCDTDHPSAKTLFLWFLCYVSPTWTHFICRSRKICFQLHSNTTAPSVAPPTMDQQEVLQEAELGDAIVTSEKALSDALSSSILRSAFCQAWPTNRLPFYRVFNDAERGTDIERLQTCPFGNVTVLALNETNERQV